MAPVVWARQGQYPILPPVTRQREKRRAVYPENRPLGVRMAWEKGEDGRGCSQGRLVGSEGAGHVPPGSAAGPERWPCPPVAHCRSATPPRTVPSPAPRAGPAHAAPHAPSAPWHLPAAVAEAQAAAAERPRATGRGCCEHSEAPRIPGWFQRETKAPPRPTLPQPEPLLPAHQGHHLGPPGLRHGAHGPGDC